MIIKKVTIILNSVKFRDSCQVFSGWSTKLQIIDTAKCQTSFDPVSYPLINVYLVKKNYCFNERLHFFSDLLCFSYRKLLFSIPNPLCSKDR